MPLTIPDNVLDELRAKAPETLIELACRLYTADVIVKPEATRLASLERVDFEAELTKRGLPWIRITADDYWEQERAGLERWADCGSGRPRRDAHRERHVADPSLVPLGSGVSVARDVRRGLGAAGRGARAGQAASVVPVYRRCRDWASRQGADGHRTGCSPCPRPRPRRVGGHRAGARNRRGPPAR